MQLLVVADFAVYFCYRKLSLPQNVKFIFLPLRLCVPRLSGRPPRGSAMAVSPVAASDQAQGGSESWRVTQPLAAEQERAGREQEDLGEHELCDSRGRESMTK